MTLFLNWLALVLAVVVATGLLLSRDWRWSLGFLAVLYVSVFWLTQSHWPMSMATVKLITGWMVCATLGITQAGASGRAEAGGSWPQGRLFRFFAAALALTISFALAIPAAAWLGLDLPVAWGGLVLIGMGLLHLGITDQPFRVILGLLTLMAGFEVLYAAVEGSILVAALLVVVNLGLALAGSYFLTAGAPEETP